MRGLSEDDLKAFQQALIEDYGLKLEGNDLCQAARALIQFIDALIKFDLEDKNKINGQKVLKSSKGLS